MNVDRVNELYIGTIFSPETQRACRDRIHWICSQASGKSVLDIGCSQGIVCLILGREGFECVGIDIEEDSIEYARRELEKEGKIVQKRVQFEIEDATNLSFDDNAFDTVILGEIIEHLVDPRRVLSEAKRVLKKNGRVILTTPFGLNPHHDHKHTFYPLSFLELVQPFFRTEFIDTADNYFRYCGISDSSYDSRNISKDTLLADYSRLLRKLEERCEGKEIELFEKSTKLYDQIKTLNEQSGKLKTALTEKEQYLKLLETRREEIEKKEKDLFSLLQAKDKELQETLLRQRKDYNERLMRKDADFQQALIERDNKLYEALNKQRKDFSEAMLRKDAEFNETIISMDKQLQDTLDRQRKDFNDKTVKKEWEFRNELKSREKEFENSLDQHRKDFQSAIANKDEEIAKKEESWKETLRQKEEEDRRKLIQRENELTANRRWRVGQFIINPIELAVDFLKQPIQTSKRVFRSISKGEMPQSLGSLSMKAKKPRSTTTHVSHAPIIEIKEPRKAVPESKKITVAAVLDEFSMSCFAPECNLVTFRTDNWKETLQETKPELLLVESAWRGNDGSWQYKVASYQKPMGEELVDLVDYCKSNGIPTVFWNKEDPSNYDRFIHRAPLFDYVFTTDEECIPKYRARLGHDRIYALPFAAQPKIHNPIIERPREHNVAFAGAYYNISFDERKKDMDLVLKPALDYGLHIYDRQHGVVGQLAEQFRFPDIYQPAIKGRLEYDEMVKAYKKYKVFLNVNSVKTSPTMFSRRVFELLACGTPVISAYARGIEEIFGTDLVLLTRSEEETHAHLERLLKNDDEWLRISVRGMRKVLDSHTYLHRLNEILSTIGKSFTKSHIPKITVVACPETTKHLRIISFTLKQQTYRNIHILLFPGKLLKKSDIEEFIYELKNCPVATFSANSNVVENITKYAEGDYVWLFNWKDYYGPDFLKDNAIATSYSESDIIGKHTHYELGPNGSTIEFKGSGHEFMQVQSVVPGSAIIRKGRLSSLELSGMIANRTITVGKERALSINRFNFIRNAFVTDHVTRQSIEYVASRINLS